VSAGLRSEAGSLILFVGVMELWNVVGDLSGEDRSGMWPSFRRFATRGVDEAVSPPTASSVTAFNGLDGVCARFKARAVKSRRALLAALGLDGTRVRGVKNRRNFLGVMEG
jgi:hypothetical protein